MVSRNSRGPVVSAADDGAAGIWRDASQPRNAAATPQPPTTTGTVGKQDDASAKDRSQQDREEGSRLDERVACNQFVLTQMLREERVLDRSEDRRMGPEAEERRKEQRHARLP
jgi:hypothetical protein